MLELYLPLLKPFLYLLVFVLAMKILRMLYINLLYRNSRYGAVSGNTFLKTFFSTGNYGEFLTFRMLEKLKDENRLLTNIYIPKEDGTTTEIDLLMITKTGIYVFESKNYSGWIFGDEKSKMWTQSLNGRTKNRFFNPIWQNGGHISALDNILKDVDGKSIYSYIVFSDRCELKKVSVSKENVYVMKRNRLLSAIKEDINKRAACFSSNQISDIYALLQNHTLADEMTKQKHIDSIKSKG